MFWSVPWRNILQIAPLLGCLVYASPNFAAQRVRFNEQVRPLLSDRCFACHGPDEKHREAELRLDVRDHAIEHAAIVPGRPDASELWKRITSHDPDVQMPPPVSKKPPFTERELNVLKKWIEEGAEYEGHWAFLPLQTDPPPSVPGADHPIDSFIRKRLNIEGLTASPEADRATLIRRVSLDLLGLPPSPDEVEQFEEDPTPNAFERLVDRLLASPHYGERWGRHWLDQARYADSNGYAIDAPREMWPYRDWVIEAFNRDLPFDQFTTEQLAGDLLPSPTKSQLVATGFHRNTLINQEGGSDKEQFRVEAVMDRVTTTGAVWLGLTVGCAQCHTHKFDPITQREYYHLFAFFNSAQDANDRGPTVEVARGEMFGSPLPRQPSGPTEEELARLKADWEHATRARLEEQASGNIRSGNAWRPAQFVDASTTSGKPLRQLDDGSLLSDPDSSDNDAFTVRYASDLTQIIALRLRALTHESLPRNGPGRAGNGNFVLTGLTLSVDNKPQPFQRATADHEQPNYPVEAAIDGDPKTGWAINVGPGSTAKMNANHEAVFTLAKPIPLNGKPFIVTLSHDVNAKYLVGRFAIDVAAVPPPDREVDLALLPILQKPISQRTPAEHSQVEEAFKSQMIAGKRDEKKTTNTVVAQAMILRDLAQPRDTFLLTRGDFTRPNKELGALPPGVIGAIAPQLPEGSFRNRLDLARWLAHPENPLTPRVTVNRIWMRYFGRGLVETDEDFGAQGAPPTHPDLLDWLSREFMNRSGASGTGWSMKRLHRLIVTSATYRQSSRLRPDLAEKDPRNRWLARQERFRMEAEITRDAALVASGLLEPAIGGPSVHPPQTEGVYAFTQVKKNWPTDTGPNRYRRGLYTFFYRSAPYPLFSTFDTPDFQAVCTRRLRSNTPLQALTLSNDETFLEFAQALALRLMFDVPGEFEDTLDSRIERACRLCFSRHPTEHEVRILRNYVATQERVLRENREATAALIGGISKSIESPSESAALVLLSRTLFNADNFITRE